MGYGGSCFPKYVKALINTARVDARTNCEAISVSPNKKTVDLRNVKTGEVTTEAYDKLVLSPGAASVHPPLPGIDLPGIFHVRTVPDAKTIREWIEKGTTFLAGMFNYSGIQMVKPVRRAVVVGGGFIGLETAENLVHLGFKTRNISGGTLSRAMYSLAELIYSNDGSRGIPNAKGPAQTSEGVNHGYDL